MEVFSLQWLLLNYSAKVLPTIKLNYAYCNQRRLLYRLGHITPYCSIQWPRSFRHIAVNSTCQHHCSTAYQVCCSNPHTLDCSICTFHSTLKWQRYIHEVLHLLANALILHLLSVISCLSLLKSHETQHFLDAKLSPYELSQNSQAMIMQDVFFSCWNEDLTLSVV